MRRSGSDENALGHNSFLDVVTNMVGILIILVMVLGNTIKNAPVTVAPDARIESVSGELQSSQAAEAAIRRDVMQTAEMVASVEHTLDTRLAERSVLATRVTEAQHAIEDTRKSLGGSARQEFDADRAVAAAKSELTEVQRALLTTASEAPPVELQHYPTEDEGHNGATPISRQVDGEEINFQLRGGLIAAVPIHELLEKVFADFRRSDFSFSGDRKSGRMGPVDGFLLTYELRRADDTLPNGRVITKVHQRYEFLQVVPKLGETIDEALAAGSQFRMALGRTRPQQTVVTLWTYPDSFSQFRRLKAELYRLGYPIAGRPLPEGVPISSSDRGSKSAAE
jgi:hypothetical protein